MVRTTLKPLDFIAGEALEARRRDNPNITLAQNDIPKFFKFLQKKNSRLDKKAPANFLQFWGLEFAKIMWQYVYFHSISAGNLFYQAWKFFSAEI